jgi:tripartite-type tricarboxylate transporter receptor subunit TctC
LSLALPLAALPLARPARGGEPLRVIVPFAAGSAYDLLIRVIAPKLEEVLGTRLLTDHRPGAGGTLGTALAARARPDGATLLLTGSSHTISARLYPKLAYHPLESFEPVALLGRSGLVIAASAMAPETTLEALVRRAQAEPGVLLQASSGTGSVSHLAMAILFARTGVRMRHLELQSAGQVVLELLAGRAQVAAIPVPNAMAVLGDRRIRLLAYTAAERSPFLPSVPTVAESGWADAVFDTWAGFLAPVGTPRRRVEALARASEATLADPEARERLARIGAVPGFSGPSQARAVLAAEWAVAESVARDARSGFD